MKPQKCIIDNWSLEHASILLDDNLDLRLGKGQALSYFGGLSNFVAATLLYESPYFIKNGFETGWKSSKWFKQNATLYIKGTSLKELNIPWKSKRSYKDKGAANYLLTAEYFESDLIVSPERAHEVGRELPNIKGRMVETLDLVDRLVKDEAKKLAFKETRFGIKKNLLMPGLTQYVLKEASNRGDVLKVIMQLRSDGKMKRITDKIEDMASSTRGAAKLQREVEKLVKKTYGKAQDSNSPSIAITAMFLSLGWNMNLDFFKRDEYFVFLRDIISCRAEARRLEKDIKRVFGKRLLQ